MATGYLHVSAWPALRAALQQRGIAVDGPLVGATATGAPLLPRPATAGTAFAVASTVRPLARRTFP